MEKNNNNESISSKLQNVLGEHGHEVLEANSDQEAAEEEKNLQKVYDRISHLLLANMIPEHQKLLIEYEDAHTVITTRLIEKAYAIGMLHGQGYKDGISVTVGDIQMKAKILFTAS